MSWAWNGNFYFKTNLLTVFYDYRAIPGTILTLTELSLAPVDNRLRSIPSLWCHDQSSIVLKLTLYKLVLDCLSIPISLTTNRAFQVKFKTVKKEASTESYGGYTTLLTTTLSWWAHMPVATMQTSSSAALIR